MDVVDLLILLESGEATNKQMLEGFSDLARKGLIPHLQGAYGRMFNIFVNDGFMDPNGDITAKGRLMIDHEGD